MRRRSLTQRPDSYTLDLSHPLAKSMCLFLGGHGRGSLTARDDSAYRNNGTLTNLTATAWVHAIGRWALAYPGTNAYVVSLSAANWLSTGNFSIGAWCWEDPIAGANATIIGQGDTGAGEWMLRESGTTLSFYGNAGGISAASATSVVPKSTWFHAATVRLGGLVTVYKDGIAVATDTTSTDDLTGGGKAVTVGGADDIRPWKGMLADIIVAKRSWSEGEIRILSNRADPMLGGMLLPPRRVVFASAGAAPATNRRRRIICGAD